MKDTFDENTLGSLKKKKINSRTKGNRFENKIANILNERFGTQDFCRSPGSGAFATTHKLPEHMKVHGDLITPKSFRFSIECKKGYNKEKLGDIFNPSSILSNMITQACKDSRKSSKEFLLIIGQDRKDPLEITDANVDGRNMKQYLAGWIYNNSITVATLKHILELDDSFFKM